MEMPNHVVAYFKLPIEACKDIEKSIRNYWRRGNESKNEVHWVSSMRPMKQKKHGGLGFRDIQCFNLALLAKIG